MTEHPPVEYVDQEAARRIEDLQGPFELAHQYAQVERATLMSDGEHETDGEHGISTGIILASYVTKYYPDINPYEAFFYGVMHDVDEVLEGDVPTIAITPEGMALKNTSEERGAEYVRQVFAAFPGFIKMLDDMRDLRKPVNQLGKAMDKNTPGFTHEANLGQVLKEVYGLTSYEDLLEAVKLTDKKMLDYAADYPDVIAMRQEMHRKVARIAFKRPLWVDVPLFEM
jgi:5'-deoxynucleotidase YfbR-like HD superfamily hydrolase